MKLEIADLSKTRLDDFLHYFDDVAFTDNPGWSSCYCFFYHFDGSEKEWLKRDKKENRSSAIEFIKNGQMQGFIAYIDDKPVGWCNVNRKDSYELLNRDSRLKTDDDSRVISIVCFLIAPGYRKKGIAGKLLEKISEHYQNRGYLYLEAYPLVEAHSDAEHYHGPLSLYIKNGFEVFKHGAGYSIVRKKI